MEEPAGFLGGPPGSLKSTHYNPRRNQFSDADTYGIVVIAHGDPNQKGDFSDAGPDYVTPAEAAGNLHHKLAGFKAIWCYSGVKRQEWRDLVSPNGWFYSKRGKIRVWDAQPGVIHHGF
jgi:hypothetical protein